MYTIGEFSKINRITTKTLRHYDKIGLLKPAKIDDWTGYRYYDTPQLITIKKILILKDFGIPLEMIKSVILKNLKTSDVLKDRLNIINIQIKEDLKKIKSIEEFIANNGEIQMKELIIKPLPKVLVASMRTIVPSYDTYFSLVPRMGEYMHLVGAECLEPAYCFTIYHDGEYKETDIDVEICEAVTSLCKENDEIKFKTVDYVPEAACLLHKGPYSTIKKTYNDIFQLIDKNGYTIIDNPRESYIDGIWNKDDPNEWLTEIQIPVKKRI